MAGRPIALSHSSNAGPEVGVVSLVRKSSVTDEHCVLPLRVLDKYHDSSEGNTLSGRVTTTDDSVSNPFGCWMGLSSHCALVRSGRSSDNITIGRNFSPGSTISPT